MSAARAADVLESIVVALPEGEAREGQRSMCEAVESALTRREHLLVQAGTGTGKSLAYLVPAILACGSGGRVVVVTATRALQEQVVRKDLPFIAAHLDRPFSVAVLKGRGNYLCLARHAEALEDRAGRLAGTRADEALFEAIDDWAGQTHSGDRADFPAAIPERLWDALSVDARECPGRTRCDLADGCFAEQARDRAAAADLVVVNTALYAQHLASGGHVLPPHSYAVIDEAHAVEDICSSAFGVEVGPLRLERLLASLRTLLTDEAEPDGGRASGSRGEPGSPLARLAEQAVHLGDLLESCPDDERVRLDDPGVQGLREALTSVGETLATLAGVVAGLPGGPLEVARRAARVTRLLDGARSDLQRVLSASSEDEVLWVEARHRPVLRCVSVDVGPTLAATLFTRRTVVLTSATLALAGDFGPLAWRVGLRPGIAAGDADGRDVPDTGGEAEAADPTDAEEPRRAEIPPADPAGHVALDVGSPFDYRAQAILYVAAHLPDPRAAEFAAAAREEASDLVRAAGGRALCLCTSLAAAAALAEQLRDNLDVRVLTPDELPRGRLTDELAADETSVLVGSMGLWQGLDVPGPAVSLVVIDKIPFARPTDPLAVARREQAAAAGHNPFETFDLPRAAVLLAQGAGRLIRSHQDRGVVAVLDPRLATSRYGARLVASLPPMYGLTDPARVRAALTRLRDTREASRAS